MSSRLELILRGGSVVTPERVTVADVGVANGKFVRIAPSIAEHGAQEVDASGLHVFPGILDAHVHFNEPGRSEWEGLTTGSTALAAAGGTWFADMPLNSTPPVIDAASFAAKCRLAEQKSATDFSLWGGLVPDSIARLGELRDAGAIGVKAFMCQSGLAEYPAITSAGVLRAGMKRAAELGLLVAVHAEDEAVVERLAKAAQARGIRDVRSWLATRPVEAELSAIRLALELAGETRCALHVVHVSSPEGLSLIADARRRGVNVSAETCPHYLLLNEDDVVRLGAPAKCSPPLRREAARQGIWRAITLGFVDTIGSDHSPASPDRKQGADFFSVWGGISGVQHGFPLLLSAAIGGMREQWALTLMASLMAANVAQRFHLPGKGRIAEGNDADCALLDLREERRLANTELLYRHRQGPYEGCRCRVRVVQTYVRGRRVWGKDGITLGAVRGHLYRPTPATAPAEARVGR